jgi:hypothetical protein
METSYHAKIITIITIIAENMAKHKDFGCAARTFCGCGTKKRAGRSIRCAPPMTVRVLLAGVVLVVLVLIVVLILVAVLVLVVAIVVLVVAVVVALHGANLLSGVLLHHLL